MPKTIMRMLRVAVMAGCAGFLLIEDAQAQRLEEIVVTAQKREEKIQDVPISVSAVLGDKLSQLGISNFENFDIPGVKIARGGMADTYTVRGIGSGQNPGFEQSAPLYVDGIYYGNGRVQRVGFLDLERLEVLKGPQPTYLGKNAIAGAINLSTRGPTSEFKAQGEVSYEPVTDEFSIFGAASGPITDKFSARVALKYRKSEGYLTNTATNRREPEVRDQLGRISLQFNPNDALTARLTAYVGKNKDIGRNNQMVSCIGVFNTNVSPPSAEDCQLNRVKASFGTIPVTGGDSKYYFDAGGASFLFDFKVAGANARFDYEFPSGLTFTSLTGYYLYTFKNFTDSDQGIANLVTNTTNARYWQISEEVRLVSPSGEKLKWLAGAYVDKNKDRNYTSQSTNNALAIPGSPLIAMAAASNSQLGQSFVEAKSWAAFGELGYEIVDTLTPKVGLRYEEVRKASDSSQCVANIYTNVCRAGTTVARLGDALVNKQLQPTVTLEYRPNSGLLMYASYKRGFKAGGFQLDNVSPTFLPEKVRAWEVGAKLGFLDGRATVNLAAFLSDYSNLQVASYNTLTDTTTIRNAAQARTKGIEAEGRVAVTSELTLGASVVLLDAAYRNYANAPCYALQTVATGCSATGTFQSLTGAHLPNAPTFSGNGSISYSRPVSSSLKISVDADVFFTNRFYTLSDQNPGTFQEGFGKVNARIALAEIDDRWELAVVGHNLTNKTTAAFRNATPMGGGSLAAFTEPPRMFTFQARVKY